MKRRTFFQSAGLGGIAAAMSPLASCSQVAHTDQKAGERYKLLGEVLQQPVFKKELFTSPVIIASVVIVASGMGVGVKVEGMMNFCIPYITIEPIISKLSTTISSLTQGLSEISPAIWVQMRQ